MGRWRAASLTAALLLTLLSACDDEIVTVDFPTDASADRAGDSAPRTDSSVGADSSGNAEGGASDASTSPETDARE
jgi:hypothetical protein